MQEDYDEYVFRSNFLTLLQDKCNDSIAGKVYFTIIFYVCKLSANTRSTYLKY